MRAMLKSRLVTAFAGLFFCTRATAQTPLWSADLQSNAAYRAAAANSLRQSKKVVVLDDNSVLVLWSFLYKDSSSALLVLLDGATGSVRNSVALREFRGAMMTADGFDVLTLPGNRYLLEIGDELRLGRAPNSTSN